MTGKIRLGRFLFGVNFRCFANSIKLLQNYHRQTNAVQIEFMWFWFQIKLRG